MDKTVAIIGVAQSKYVEASKDALTDIIFETSAKALEDANLKINDIESVTLAAHDMVDGRAITSMLTAPPAGAYLKDEIRVTEDGAFAVALACLRILTGDFATSLVVSWSKCSECAGDTMHKVANLSYDPFFYRPFALNDVTSYAIQAQQYMYKYNITESQAAQVVAKNRANGLKNELAHLQSKVTADEVMESKPMSYPLKVLDLPPWSDGACALVLANETVAKKSKRPCAWITGFGWASDTYYSGDKDLAHLESLSLAANQAYKMAGISNPFQDIDVAEIHDITSFHELMEYEALGFCPQGKGGKYLESGATAIDGDIPVNPSGGCLSSNPYTAVGLIRVAEAALQVTGRAGKHQIDGAKTALAHGISGLSAQSNCVIILNK
jgi:acetyl-CoA C-acetyltransferase